MAEDMDEEIKAISTLISVLRPLESAARTHVLEFVLRRLGIELGAQAQPSRGAFIEKDVPADNERSTGPSPSSKDIRSFAIDKKPSTVNERVALVGYYLAHLAPESERRDFIVSEDIKTYFIQAGFPLPSAPPNMTLTNAKNAGYLNALDRGQYKLNAVGYNLVAHKLPASAGNGPKKKAPQLGSKVKGNKAKPRRKVKK